MLITAALLLPLIWCAPTPDESLGQTKSDDSTDGLQEMANTVACMRECIGFKGLDSTGSERTCLRYVDRRTLWDQGWTYTLEGPDCGVYTTAVQSSPNMGIFLPSVGQEIRKGPNDSDTRYTTCLTACLGERTSQTCENGHTEFELITKGGGDAVDWAALEGSNCKYVLTMITTWKEGIPILLFDDEVALNLTIVNGEMQAEQILREVESNTELPAPDGVGKVGENVLCARKCLGMEPEGRETTKLELRALKSFETVEGGWYERFTFDGPHEFFTTRVVHDARTRIRMGKNRDEPLLEVSSVHFDEGIAQCLSECYDDEEFNAHAQSCSEHALYPVWSIVDYGTPDDDHRGNYIYITLSIPGKNCNGLSTFILTERRDFVPIHIVYSNEDREIFSIDNERAISNVLHSTNTSLLN